MLNNRYTTLVVTTDARKNVHEVHIPPHQCQLICDFLTLPRATLFVSNEHDIPIVPAKHIVEAVRRYYTKWPAVAVAHYDHSPEKADFI